MQRNYCTSIPQEAGIPRIPAPASRRHSHHHHVIPAKAGIQRPASDDALVEAQVVARLSARATF